MIPIQELSFHLDSGEIVFGCLVSLGDGTFSAQVTAPYQANQLPQVKFYQWLACPARATSKDAFQEIIGALGRKGNRDGSKLIKVNNPCNCEFLPQSIQQQIVGTAVAVVVNEAV